ncbi:MAG: sterol desaturase [Alphaproteobacteria bacterium]|nr:sterol desaturase [Alphaproteobacteria bacterium]
MLIGFSASTIGLIKALPFCGSLLVLAAAEAWWPLRRDSAGPPGRLGGNIGMGLINALLTVVLPVSTVVSAGWAARHQIGLMNLVALPVPIVIVATLLLRSFATYANHRLSHAVPLLWRVHRVHHADTHLDLSTGFRNHPLELAIIGPLLAAVTIAFGFDARTLVVYETVSVLFALWTHLNIRLSDRLERRLRWLIVTPAMHCVHHSSVKRETDSNYGDMVSLWDRLFGTCLFLPRDALVATRLGLGDEFDDGAASLARQLRSPFERTRARAPLVLPSEA